MVLRGACPHDCPDTCATLVEVRDGRAVGFRGDPVHPITQGWLCAKVRPYLQRVYAPDRLQYPLRRVGAKGTDEWTRISWEDAIAEITRLKAEDGGPMNIGGATLAGAALRAGLIDEYAIATHPVLVGGGTPFFTALDGWVNLNLVETRTFPGGVVLTRYETRTGHGA